MSNRASTIVEANPCLVAPWSLEEVEAFTMIQMKAATTILRVIPRETLLHLETVAVDPPSRRSLRKRNL
jgi:hypothetical protein